MKTLNIDLDKLSRKGLKAYLTLLEEFDDYKMIDGDPDEVGVELPLPEMLPENKTELPPMENNELPPPPDFKELNEFKG